MATNHMSFLFLQKEKKTLSGERDENNEINTVHYLNGYK